MSRFASGKIALGICDICGFQYKLRELRDLIIKGRNSNLMACPECWNPDQPQLSLGTFPVDDPQAIRNPRPDYNQYAQSRAVTIPVRGVVGTGFIGTVTVVIT